VAAAGPVAPFPARLLEGRPLRPRRDPTSPPKPEVRPARVTGPEIKREPGTTTFRRADREARAEAERELAEVRRRRRREKEQQAAAAAAAATGPKPRSPSPPAPARRPRSPSPKPAVPRAPSPPTPSAEQRLQEYAALAGELRAHLDAAGGAGNAVADRRRYERVIRENLLHLGRLRERLEPEERARLKVPLRRARAALEGLLERSMAARPAL
jgi:hypothetical protein